MCKNKLWFPFPGLGLVMAICHLWFKQCVIKILLSLQEQSGHASHLAACLADRKSWAGTLFLNGVRVHYWIVAKKIVVPVTVMCLEMEVQGICSTKFSIVVNCHSLTLTLTSFMLFLFWSKKLSTHAQAMFVANHIATILQTYWVWFVLYVWMFEHLL
jgi:hypothetical protein